MEIERAEWGAPEKYHNMEGVQLKKAPSSIPLPRTLPLSLLHLSISGSKLKVTISSPEKLRNVNSEKKLCVPLHYVWFLLERLFNDSQKNKNLCILNIIWLPPPILLFSN